MNRNVIPILIIVAALGIVGAIGMMVETATNRADAFNKLRHDYHLTKSEQVIVTEYMAEHPDEAFILPVYATRTVGGTIYVLVPLNDMKKLLQDVIDSDQHQQKPTPKRF